MTATVELAPEVIAALGDRTRRQVRNAVSDAVTLLTGGELDGRVRPWDLAALRRGIVGLGEVTAARAVHLDAEVLVAQLLPAGRFVALRKIEHGWRLARFVEPGVTTLPPETTRRVPLDGWGPDAVLAALGLTLPDGVELEYTDVYLGQGETEYRHGYRWTEGSRTVRAEQVKREIFDGATPYTSYLHGVVVDGDGGRILTGSGDSALLIEG